jgi:uncharacterized protein (TIGR02996 family)
MAEDSSMSRVALRKAWVEWCGFVDALDLSDGSPDCAALHGRLFRLSGSHPLRPRELRAASNGVRAALGPWLDEKESESTGELEWLRRAVAACEPGWRALLGTAAGRPTDWSEVERMVLTAGLSWPERFWASPLHVEGQPFDLLLAMRGRNHAASVALLDALLYILNHSSGLPLFEWARSTPTLTRPAQALQAAALFRDMIAAGAIQSEWLEPLGWGQLPKRLLQLCEDICRCLLVRLNEPMPVSAVLVPVQGATGQRPAAKRNTAAAYRRAIPEPLPIEPWFKKVRGSEAFLRAIAEEPLEDAHRLVFADWLEEHGHPERARFIRLQCEHERLPDHPLARRRSNDQITELFKEHGKEWTAGLPSREGVTWNEVGNFRRGLLEDLEITASMSLEDCAELFQHADLRGLQIAYHVVFYTPERETAGARDLPCLSRLVSLEVSRPYTGLRELVGAPGLVGLVDLKIAGLYTADISILAESMRLPALASLDLSRSGMSDQGAQALAANQALSGLRRLRVGGSSSRRRRGRVGLGLPGIRALASSPTLANLEHLDVGGNGSQAAGVESLAASPFLANLTTLVLDGSTVGVKGAKALADSPFLKRLACLSLGWSGLTDEGARLLARSANLANLTVLDLSSNRHFGAAGIRALGSSPHLTGLRALSLRGMWLSLEGAQALAESPNFANLDTLDLSSTSLDGPASLALARSRHLNNLAVLELKQGYNTIPSAAKRALRKRWPFARL